MKKIILILFITTCSTGFAYAQLCPGAGLNFKDTANLCSCCNNLVLNTFADNAYTYMASSDLPGGIAFAAGFTINNTLYAGLGADDAGDELTAIWQHDENDGPWTQVADFPGSGRGYPFSFSLNSKGYIGGGVGSGGFYQDMYEYSPLDNNWTAKASFGGGEVYEATSFSINNKGYVTGNANPGVNGNDLWEYDPLADHWSKKATYPGLPRIGGGAFNIGNKAYLAGGYSLTGIDGSDNVFYEYDQVADKWTRRANFPGPLRIFGNSFAINGKGYFGLGEDYADFNTPLTDVWAYDPATDTWSPASSFNGPARLFTLVLATATKAYVTTGADPSTGTSFSDVWVYDPTTALDNYQWSKDGVDLGLSTPSITATATGNYTVTASNNSCPGYTATVTVVAAPQITAVSPAIADYNTPVGINGARFYNVKTVTIGGVPAAFFSVYSSDSITAYPSPSASSAITTVNVVAGCDTALYDGLTVDLIPGLWTGNADNDWFNTNNWSDGNVPGAATDVYIPAGVYNTPVIIADNAVANEIDIDPYAYLKVGTGGVLTLKGGLYTATFIGGSPVDAMDGSLVFSGTSPQEIDGDVDVKNLTIDNAAGVSLYDANDGYTYVYGVYTPKAGTLTTNDALVLASTAETGTAMVAAGTGTYIDGNVEVDRYIPAYIPAGATTPKRAWRLLTAPVGGAGAIFDNWQNSGNVCSCGAASGAEIFKPGGTGAFGDGFTDGGVEPSLQYYDENLDDWVNVDDTHNAMLSDAAKTAAANKAYAIFITGPYGSNTISSGDEATTLHSFGTLQTGDQQFSYTGVGTGHYILIGNPYASPVDLTKVTAVNTTNNYWLLDPRKTGQPVGGYVNFSYDGIAGTWDVGADPSTVAGESQQTMDLQSGQAVFVQVLDGSQDVSLTFTEASKSANNNDAVFFAPTTANARQLRITLNKTVSGRTGPVDGILAKFGDSYKKGISDDAAKLFDYNENLSVVIDANYMGISRLPVPVPGDSMLLYINGLKSKSAYSFTLKPQKLDGIKVKAWLVDRFAKTQTAIDLTQQSYIAFATTGDKTSYNGNRFYILFAEQATLASTLTNLKAVQQDKGVQVQWTTATEQGVLQYQVERSANGQQFTAVGTAAPRNTGLTATYSLYDAQPLTGDNYYRIKVLGKDAAPYYSNVVLVKFDRNRPQFSIYPNPVPRKQQLTVQLNNMAAGKYTLQLFNTEGKKVMERVIVSDGSSLTQAITLPTGIAAASYRFVLFNKDGNTWKQPIVVVE